MQLGARQVEMCWLAFATAVLALLHKMLQKTHHKTWSRTASEETRKRQASNEAEKWGMPLKFENCINKDKTKNQRHSAGPCPCNPGSPPCLEVPDQTQRQTEPTGGRHVREPLKRTIQTSL